MNNAMRMSVCYLFFSTMLWCCDIAYAEDPECNGQTILDNQPLELACMCPPDNFHGGYWELWTQTVYGAICQDMRDYECNQESHDLYSFCSMEYPYATFWPEMCWYGFGYGVCWLGYQEPGSSSCNHVDCNAKLGVKSDNQIQESTGVVASLADPIFDPLRAYDGSVDISRLIPVRIHLSTLPVTDEGIPKQNMSIMYFDVTIDAEGRLIKAEYVPHKISRSEDITPALQLLINEWQFSALGKAYNLRVPVFNFPPFDLVKGFKHN